MYGQLFDKPFMQAMLQDMKPGLKLFNDGGTGGGGGGGTGTPPPGTGTPPPDATATALAAAQAQIKEMQAAIAKLTPGTGTPPPADKTLAEKAEAERLAREKNQTDVSKIERDLTYNLGVKKFVEDHKAFLSEDVQGILAQAEKEKYDSAGQKAAELRTEIIEAFFKVQANSDILTAAQKRILADFGKLTKDGKRQDSEKVYESVFEPALEMVKRVKKAEELNLAARGYATATGGPLGAYKQKLLEAAKRVIINKRKAG